MNDTQRAQQLFNSLLASYDAKVKSAQANPVNEISTLTLDLSEGRPRNNPLQVSFPFKNVRIEEASDLNCMIRLIPESADSHVGDIALTLKDSYSSEFGFSKCFLYWHSQPGRKVVIKFFTTSKIDNGQLLLNESSVTQNINVGYHTLQQDSLTVVNLQEVISNNAFNPTDFPYNQMFDSGNPKRIYQPILGPNQTGGREVPLGYQMELLSVEAYLDNVGTIGTGTFAEFSLYKVKKDRLFATNAVYNSTDYKSINTGLRLRKFTSADLGVVYRSIISQQNNEYSSTIIDEDELILPYMYMNGTATGFRFKVIVLGRLVRKVG